MGFTHRASIYSGFATHLRAHTGLSQAAERSNCAVLIPQIPQGPNPSSPARNADINILTWGLIQVPRCAANVPKTYKKRTKNVHSTYQPYRWCTRAAPRLYQKRTKNVPKTYTTRTNRVPRLGQWRAKAAPLMYQKRTKNVPKTVPSPYGRYRGGTDGKSAV